MVLKIESNGVDVWAGKRWNYSLELVHVRLADGEILEAWDLVNNQLAIKLLRANQEYSPENNLLVKSNKDIQYSWGGRFLSRKDGTSLLLKINGQNPLELFFTEVAFLENVDLSFSGNYLLNYKYLRFEEITGFNELHLKPNGEILRYRMENGQGRINNSSGTFNCLSYNGNYNENYGRDTKIYGHCLAGTELNLLINDEPVHASLLTPAEYITFREKAMFTTALR
jgi:hypothetical protein